MVRTTVYLDADTALAIREISARRKRPQAELIREALRDWAVKDKPPLPGGLGKFRSGRTDVSSNYRELLKKEMAEGRWP